MSYAGVVLKDTLYVIGNAEVQEQAGRLAGNADELLAPSGVLRSFHFRSAKWTASRCQTTRLLAMALF